MRPIRDHDVLPISMKRIGAARGLMRSYTTGFVTNQQSNIELEASAEWDSLLR